MSDELYIGLMSGTSMDGIDAVLTEIGDQSCKVLGTHVHAYSGDLRQRLKNAVQNPASTNLIEMGCLSCAVAISFADAALGLLEASKFAIDKVSAIGSHGQTIFHHPHGPEPFSTQLGDPGTLAAIVGITVVADFRNTDLALGGQGAPLAPAFHRWAFGATGVDRAVVNIGGIANVTLLNADGSTAGFDTGPGNTLLDQWCKKHQGLAYDEQGQWAAQGHVHSELLRSMRDDAYFKLSPPKSTGLEYFNLDWLNRHLKNCSVQPSSQDTQATLSECAAQEIAAGIRCMPNVKDVAVCGGGAYNEDLLQRLRRALPQCHIDSTIQWGMDPAWVEAIAFAWMARQRLHGMATNIPAVTGARAPVSLGGVYLPPGRISL
jgi:anhydro-N-acetylmuramic acid kinase